MPSYEHELSLLSFPFFNFFVSLIKHCLFEFFYWNVLRVLYSIVSLNCLQNGISFHSVGKESMRSFRNYYVVLLSNSRVPFSSVNKCFDFFSLEIQFLSSFFFSQFSELPLSLQLLLRLWEPNYPFIVKVVPKFKF